MRTLSTVVPVILLGLLLASCQAESDHPLASPDTAKIDPQLLGDWHDQDGETTFHITALDGHWMHVVITPKQAKPSDAANIINNAPQNYDFFITNIGSDHFLNAVDEQKIDGRVTKRYVFFRYAVSPGHRLQIWSLSQDAVADAIHTGKLKGVVHGDARPSSDFNVTILDSSANINRFIRSGGGSTFFTVTPPPLYPGKPPVK